MTNCRPPLITFWFVVLLFLLLLCCSFFCCCAATLFRVTVFSFCRWCLSPSALLFCASSAHYLFAHSLNRRTAASSGDWFILIRAVLCAAVISSSEDHLLRRPSSLSLSLSLSFLISKLTLTPIYYIIRRPCFTAAAAAAGKVFDCSFYRRCFGVPKKEQCIFESPCVFHNCQFLMINLLIVSTSTEISSHRFSPPFLPAPSSTSSDGYLIYLVTIFKLYFLSTFHLCSHCTC